VVYTFSNKEAFERLITILEGEYGAYLPNGEIYIIYGYCDWAKVFERERNDLTYEELRKCTDLHYSPFKSYDLIKFGDWEKFKVIKKIVKKDKDIFGKVIIEVQ
jgi:hypothetical protein